MGLLNAMMVLKHTQSFGMPVAVGSLINKSKPCKVIPRWVLGLSGVGARTTAGTELTRS